MPYIASVIRRHLRQARAVGANLKDAPVGLRVAYRGEHDPVRAEVEVEVRDDLGGLRLVERRRPRGLPEVRHRRDLIVPAHPPHAVIRGVVRGADAQAPAHGAPRARAEPAPQHHELLEVQQRVGQEDLALQGHHLRRLVPRLGVAGCEALTDAVDLPRDLRQPRPIVVSFGVPLREPLCQVLQRPTESLHIHQRPLGLDGQPLRPLREGLVVGCHPPGIVQRLVRLIQVVRLLSELRAVGPGVLGETGDDGPRRVSVGVPVAAGVGYDH